MTFEKKWYSYLLWACYAVFACLGFLAVLYGVLQKSPLTNPYGQTGIACLSFILTAGIFLCIRKLVAVKGKAAKKKGLAGILVEALLVVLILSAGILLRMHFFGSGVDEARYFETAKVTGEGIKPEAYGAGYFYSLLLRGVFLVVGNHFAAGIILQIVLQTAAAILWFFAVRRLTGPVAGVCFLAVVMLFPFNIRESLIYSPRMLLFFLCGLVLLLIGRLFKRQEREKVGLSGWLLALFSGICTGGLAYLDVMGLLFLLPVLFLTAIKGRKHALLQLFAVFTGTAATMAALFFIDALQSGKAFLRIAAVWGKLSAPAGMITFGRRSIQGMLMEETGMELLMLTGVFFLLMLGIPAFFALKRVESQALWIMLSMGFGTFYLFRFGGVQSKYNFFGLAVLAALAGACVQAVIRRADAPVSNEPITDAPVADESAVAPVEDASVATAPVAVAAMAQATEKPRFIENPLPLPKKHVKKTLGYQVEVTDEKMHYDIEVPDTDDFDV